LRCLDLSHTSVLPSRLPAVFAALPGLRALSLHGWEGFAFDERSPRLPSAAGAANSSASSSGALAAVVALSPTPADTPAWLAALVSSLQSVACLDLRVPALTRRHVRSVAATLVPRLASLLLP
jgi:hypothetical protein